MMGVRTIDQLALLEGLSAAQLEPLVPLMEEVSVLKDEVIFHQGDKADFLYFVLDGKVSIRFNPYDGPALNVAEVEGGGVFGWSSAMGSSRYTSSAICLESGHFFRIEGKQLKKLCQDHPETGILILHRLAGVIAQRLRGTHQQVVELLQRGLDHPCRGGVADETSRERSPGRTDG
jgi:CRP/FNR family cyclic AMP-dependent transcriptional regulator